MKSLVNISRVMWAHREAVTVSFPMTLDGKRWRIMGHRVNVIEITMPLVILLTDDSTPENCHIDIRAAETFTAAANRLYHANEEFCTVLRPDWALPAVRWEKF